MHIPFPEFVDDSELIIMSGHRREKEGGSSVNSHFYGALVDEGVIAVGCEHDHVNDFCALRKYKSAAQHLLDAQSVLNGHVDVEVPPGPWLCYGGGAGFGGYGSYGRKYYHLRMRLWEFETSTGELKTWKRVEHADDKVDEIVLAEGRQLASSP